MRKSKSTTTKAVKPQETSLGRIIANAPFGAHFYRLGEGGRLVLEGANPAADKIFGINHRKLFGKTIEKAFPGIVGTELPGRYKRIAKRSGTFRKDVVEYEGGGIKGAFEIQAFQTEPGKMAVFFVDVTKNMKDASELKECGERYRMLFENSPDAVFIANAKTGIILNANPTAEKMLKKKLCDIIGIHQSKLHPPRLSKAIQKRFKDDTDPRTSGQPTESEVLRSDGVCVPVEIRAKLTTCSGTKVLQGVFRDISERKNAEKKTFENMRRFRSIVENMNYGYYIHDFKGNISDVNENACRMIGYTRKELIGSHLSMIDSPHEKKLIKARLEHLKKHGTLFFDGEHKRKDGTMVPVNASVRVVSCEGDGVIQSIVQDITERKRQEQVLQENEMQMTLIFDNSPSIMFVVDNTGKIVRMNRTGLNIIRQSAGLVTGRRGGDVFNCANSHATPKGCDHSQECPKCTLRNAIRETFATGNGREMFEATVPIKAGPVTIKKTFLSSTAFFRQGDKDLVLVALDDITEKLALEERLRQKQKMETVGQLAGGVAHDFNNQLAAIMGFADLLLRDPSKANLMEYAEKIILAASRSRDLTQQLLAFSRKGQMRLAEIDINDIVNEVTDMLSRSIDKRIKIRKELSADGSTLMGDPYQIQNAILNLAINARDAMPEGGVMTFATGTVEMDAEFCKDRLDEISPGPFINISVEDTGVGMDKGVLPHIFEPFFTTKNKSQGYGLGLASVYGTIKSHKGVIDVHSEPNKGTVFEIYLPASSGPSSRKITASEAGKQHQSKAKILLAEDEAIVADMATAMMSKLGHEVVLAKDGGEAVDIFKKRHSKIDIVVLDMIMPVMNGKEAFKLMKRIDPKVKAIMSSGYSFNGEAQKIMEDGILGFVQKPYKMDQLAGAIDAILRASAPKKKPR